MNVVIKQLGIGRKMTGIMAVYDNKTTYTKYKYMYYVCMNVYFVLGQYCTTVH